MIDLKKRNLTASVRNKQLLLFAFPPLLLIAFVIGLLILMISTCIKFTKGPLSTAALLKQLGELKERFDSAKAINPEQERAEMESLQNKLKTSCEPSIISGDVALANLFLTNCHSIQSAMINSNTEDKSSWIKLNALMTDFKLQYFGNSNQPT